MDNKKYGMYAQQSLTAKKMEIIIKFSGKWIDLKSIIMERMSDFAVLNPKGTYISQLQPPKVQESLQESGGKIVRAQGWGG